MSPSTPPPGGVYVPVPTFFAANDSSTEPTSAAPPLDIPTQSTHALHLARSGITGLVLLGSTGEAVHLTRAERTSVLTSVRLALRDGGFPDYPLIAGTASNTIDETIDMLTDAGSAGAGWGLVLAPGFFAGGSGRAISGERVVGWYEAVADRSPIPILVYHYPAVTNNISIPPHLFRKLSLHPNIVGAKLSHGDISAHTQIALDPRIDKEHFHVFTGLGQQLLPALLVGCVGAIDGLAGVFPRVVVRLYELVTTSDPLDREALAKIRELQYAISRAEEMVVKFGTTGIKEAISRVLGFGEPDGGRLPLARGMGYGEWEAWSEEMTELARIESELVGLVRGAVVG